MATITTSITWTTKLRSVLFRDDGDYDFTFVFLNPSDVPVRFHTYTMKADGSGIYENGVQIRPTSPANLLGDMTEVFGHFDAMLANAIAGGHVTP